MSDTSPRAQLSLVIKWPHDVPPAPIPRDLLRRLAENRLPATWAIEHPAQLSSLRAVAVQSQLIETAVLACERPVLIKCESKTAADWSAAVARQIDGIRAAGADVATIQLGPAGTDRHSERRLHALGVRAVITDATGGSAPAFKPLPFGLWQFTPKFIVPQAKSWAQLLGLTRRVDLARHQGLPALASIDLARIAAGGSRRWREVETLVAQATSGRAEHKLEIVTVAEAADRLADHHAARPQRSILRAA